MEPKGFYFPPNVLSHFLTLKKEQKLLGYSKIPGSISQ